MKVRELIEILKKHDPDMPVKKYCYTGEYKDPWKDIEYADIENENHTGEEVDSTLIL